mmetsp:Transcript_12766/g.23194  ORF Transcript_12766/g.23194 Transcript_12766/m.23194 type:complete len:215 (-) Transcript_12766:183-827(-)
MHAICYRVYAWVHIVTCACCTCAVDDAPSELGLDQIDMVLIFCIDSCALPRKLATEPISQSSLSSQSSGAASSLTPASMAVMKTSQDIAQPAESLIVTVQPTHSIFSFRWRSQLAAHTTHMMKLKKLVTPSAASIMTLASDSLNLYRTRTMTMDAKRLIDVSTAKLSTAAPLSLQFLQMNSPSSSWHWFESQLTYLSNSHSSLKALYFESPTQY